MYSIITVQQERTAQKLSPEWSHSRILSELKSYNYLSLVHTCNVMTSQHNNILRSLCRKCEHRHNDIYNRKPKRKKAEVTLIVVFAFIWFISLRRRRRREGLKTRNNPQENNGSVLSFKIGFQQLFSKHYSSFNGL